MLVQFTVENFKSFKNETTLSMVAAPIKEHEKDNTFNESKHSLLKSAVIYGANASGKSNLFMAMSFMGWFVQNSSKNTQAEEPIDYTPYVLSTETENKPTSFEIIFLYEGIQYRYGLAIDKERVNAEWLFYTPKVRELEVFTRTFQKIELSRHCRSEKRLVDKNLVRPNALFLSVSAQFNGEIATKVLSWFSKFRSISADKAMHFEYITSKMAQEEKIGSVILDFLKKADMGIEKLKIDEKEIPFDELPVFIQEDLSKQGHKGGLKTIDVSAFHKKYDKNNKMVGLTSLSMDNEESAGTQKFFSLSGPIVDTIKNGYVLVVDELCSKLHPRLIEEICSLFNSKEKNPNNAQLIFASHNTTIMHKDLFRRDQIWFVEKDRYGASELYSLAEYRNTEKGQKIRNDASYEKDYLKGRYGAIPVLRGFGVPCGN